MTVMPRRTVAAALACFGDEFAATSSAFVRGEYALWLGSGISRDVVPAVDDFLRNLLASLQEQVDPADAQCRFRTALDEILEIAGVPVDHRPALYLDQPVSSWPDLANLVARLRDRYSAVLDVRVVDEPPDYLVWVGIDAAETYGSPDLLPDVEHLCIAILMIEGVVSFVPTTNWDGLVEAAVAVLAPQPESLLKVVVIPEDFSGPDRPAELLKFHGCAVRALEDGDRYRDRLVARESQISGWASKPENAMMKQRLEFVLASKPAFVVGLSAQDANIHTMFNQASQNLVRSWPATPPAMVCADESLGQHHKHMLKVVYGDEASSAHGAAINASALLGAYAKPALLALVLYVLAEKLCALLDSVSDVHLAPAEVARMQDDLRALRDELGALADGDVRTFVDRLIIATRLVLSIFRNGILPAAAATTYEPLTVKPTVEALVDPNFPGDALGRLAIAVSLLGRGHVANEWAVRAETVAHPGHSVVSVTSATGRISEVFIVKDAGALARLEADGMIDLANSDVLAISAETIPTRATRSPRTRYGRTGASAAREVDLAGLSRGATSADDLYESFKLLAAL